MCVCVFVFLFMLLNCKNQKKTKRIKCLIWIWLNILRINKIMLYFSWKCKSMFLYIFWDLITDLLKPWNLANILNYIKSRSSLPQVRCARGANTFPSHNQSLTLRSLMTTSKSGFPSNPQSNTRWRLSKKKSSKLNEKLPHRRAGDVRQNGDSTGER